MKKFIVVIMLLVLVIISSCAKENDTDTLAMEEYLKTISRLENEILVLKQEQSEKNIESENKIRELTQKLALLNNANNDEKDKENTDGDTLKGFKYTVKNNEASITGYNGEDLEMVIPSSIDGYRVTSIDDRAFEDTTIKSVVIPDGVKKIGWFAFNGCMELKKITIPSSVTEIGYMALGNAGSTLTVYCHSDSYALAFAKSFGITYVVV